MLCPSYAGPAAQELEDSSALDVPKACSGNGGMPQSDVLENLLQKLETSQQGNRLVGFVFSISSQNRLAGFGLFKSSPSGL